MFNLMGNEDDAIIETKLKTAFAFLFKIVHAVGMLFSKILRNIVNTLTEYILYCYKHTICRPISVSGM